MFHVLCFGLEIFHPFFIKVIIKYSKVTVTIPQCRNTTKVCNCTQVCTLCVILMLEADISAWIVNIILLISELKYYEVGNK